MNERRKAYPNELFHGYTKYDDARDFVKAVRKSSFQTYSDMSFEQKKYIVDMIQKGEMTRAEAIAYLNREWPFEGVDKDIDPWTDKTLNSLINQVNSSLKKTPRVNSAADVKALNRAKEARRINSPSDVKKYNKRYR